MKTLLFGDQNSPHVFKWAGFLRDAGAVVDVIGYGEGQPPDSYAYEKLIPRPASSASPGARLGAVLGDLGLILSGGYDFLSIHFLNTRFAFYILISPRPVVLTCWGTDILVNLDRGSRMDRWIRKMALKKARVITCDAASLMEKIAASVARPEPPRMIMWGVDTKVFFPDAEDVKLRTELGIPRAATVLLSNRLAAPRYGVVEIIEAFSRQIKAPDTWLVVRIQPGTESGYQEACHAAAAGLERVRFLERPLQDKELPGLYRCADIVLHFPVSDATPVSMIEAIACGCQIACSDSLASYKAMAESYTLHRTRLEDLDDGLIGKICLARDGAKDRNLGILKSIHSREATVAQVRLIVRELGGGAGAGRG